MRYCCLFIFLLVLSACRSGEPLAPVGNAWYQTSSTVHRVRTGETLYAIAWRYDKDYRQLATINHLRAPYILSAGQKVKLETLQNSKKAVLPRKRVAHSSIKQWYWPTDGYVVSKFSLWKGNKGLDISGQVGQTVRATAAGMVAYCGSGIKGYGNLIIIKHGEEYLSAYAHNQKLLVKEGDNVKAGEKIAEMGNRRKVALLHFQIRRAGKPIDPLVLIGTRA